MAKVSFTLNTNDFRAALLGSMGFSADHIQRKTGLTPCQVQYRLRKAGVRLTDYRDGTSSSARQIMIIAEDTVGKRLKSDLDKLEDTIKATLKKAKKKSSDRKSGGGKRKARHVA